MKISQCRPLTIIAASALGLTACLNSQDVSDEDLGASTSYVLQGVGTPEACLTSDAQCLENKFYIECDPNASGVIASCLGWLAELETLPEPRHTQIELIRASTYYRLSELRNRTENPNFDDLVDQGGVLLSAEQYLQSVKAIGQMVHDAEPGNTEAMRILALTADDDREKLAWNRQIVATESPSTLTCRLLHGALYQVASTDEDRTRADSEAAGCSMSSYHDSEPPRVNWNAASTAIDHFERAGQTLRKNRFLAEVERDLAADQRLAALRNLERLTDKNAQQGVQQRVQQSLQTLCLRHTRKMLGNQNCDQALEQTLSAISELPAEVAVAYANAIMTAIRERLQPTQMIAYVDESDSIRSQLAPLVRESIIARDIESAQIYATYSMLVADDSDESLNSLLKAVALEPENSDLRQQLGASYYQQGLKEQAIEQYELAIHYGSEYKHTALRSAIERWQNELE